jgi:type I restriction enzyme M protein
MARKRNIKANAQPLTTAERLGSVIKSCRDIMRKDKGLSTDLDRLPMLTWVLFLKFLDDLEQVEQARAETAGKKYVPLISTPYRWRDFGAKPDGITGDELLAFIKNDEAVRPDGRKGPGLFAKLKSLQGAEGGDRRDVIARVFSDTSCNMKSGYLVRDVLNKVNDIHFTSTDQLHTLSRIYEGMLREMRDAAGDSGEFYTPRPVVEFMVKMINPRLGETILDPACGTGGFLVEAFQHLSAQVRTTADRRTLQTKSLYGIEAKPLPYLLCEMNLLLHGMESPSVEYANALAVRLTEIGDADRVDVVLTNPPFGGEEERKIQTNFPADMQTNETALLFLQLIMRRLRRPGRGERNGGRAAVVVPNGVLFGDGVCARIKEQLLTEFNLHTLVRLPEGVFEPYTPIPTNILFFDKSGPTKDIWCYAHPLPEDRRKYTKTAPLQLAEFEPLVQWLVLIRFGGQVVVVVSGVS